MRFRRVFSSEAHLQALKLGHAQVSRLASQAPRKGSRTNIQRLSYRHTVASPNPCRWSCGVAGMHTQLLAKIPNMINMMLEIG
jgi:hypothetical protein